MANTISLSDINETLKQQNKLLENTNRKISDVIGENKSRAGDELEARKKAERQRAITKTSPQGFRSGFNQGLAETTGYDVLSRWVTAAIGGIFGGTTVELVAGMAGRYLARGAVWGTVAGLIGVFGEGVITKIFEDLDPNNVVLSAENQQGVSRSLSEAMTIGAAGMIISKRAALAGFFGTLIGNALTSTFNLSDEEKVRMLGIELPITEADFATYGSIIGSFFAPSLISSALSSQLSGAPAGATVGRDPRTGRFVPLKASYASTFRANFAPRMGWAAVIATTGSVLGNMIADSTGSDELGSAFATTANLAAIGMMFGPTGAIVGAAIGIALAAGSWLFGWMKDQREKNLAAMESKINADTAAAEAALAEGDFGAAAQLAGSAATENLRRGQILDNAAAAESGARLGEIQEGIGAATGDVGRQINALEQQFLNIASMDNIGESERIQRLADVALRYSNLTGEEYGSALASLSGAAGFRGASYGGVMSLYDQILQSISSNPNAQTFASENIRMPSELSTWQRLWNPGQANQDRMLREIQRDYIRSLLPPLDPGSLMPGGTGGGGVAAVGQIGDINSTTVNTGGIVLNQEISTVDILNGGSSFAIVGGGGGR